MTEPVEVTQYRHAKRGTIYTVVGEAELQAAVCNPIEGDLLTIYRGEDGKLWARFRDEFHDGRFEPVLSTRPATTDEAVDLIRDAASVLGDLLCDEQPGTGDPDDDPLVDLLRRFRATLAAMDPVE